MSNISEYYVTKDTTINEVAIVYRCFLDVGGTGLPGLVPLLKITDPAGSNVALIENTDWRKVERTNIVGDYEIIIGGSNFVSFGQYTIEIDSQDPGAGKLITHFTLKGVYGTVNDISPSVTGFTTNLPSTVLDFYKDSYLLPLTGANAGCGPKKVTAYTIGKYITINALPVVPANGDAVMLIRF